MSLRRKTFIFLIVRQFIEQMNIDCSRLTLDYYMYCSSFRRTNGYKWTGT